MTQQTQSALTSEVKAMIGVSGEVVEAWGVVDAEYLRRFTQAVMDPDPRYWDQEFAESTHYGEIITPPIMVSYMASRIRPDQEDPITKAFEDNPTSDGIGRVVRHGALPPVPTGLVRVLNAGNELEIYQYPSIGDKVYFQNRYSDIRGRVGRDGKPFLIITTETNYKNQNGDLLCITRASTIRR
ncbi:MAG: MaoC family dehydratase N-terminal domain-containing protein [Chloroflexota bacterium]